MVTISALLMRPPSDGPQEITPNGGGTWKKNPRNGDSITRQGGDSQGELKACYGRLHFRLAAVTPGHSKAKWLAQDDPCTKSVSSRNKVAASSAILKQPIMSLDETLIKLNTSDFLSHPKGLRGPLIFVTALCPSRARSWEEGSRCKTEGSRPCHGPLERVVYEDLTGTQSDHAVTRDVAVRQRTG